MPPRLLAIGDVHGCPAPLETLAETVRLSADDTLVMLGDYIDRGPDSRAVIDLLIDLRERCRLVTIMGNHEEMMLRVLRGQAPAPWWLRHGGVETLDSYGFTGDLTCVPREHFDFIEACVDCYEAEDFFFVHANYVADEALDAQPAEALRWQSLGEHLPAPHASGRTAVLGHSAQRSGEVLDGGHFRCLDTFCFGGGWLTAMDVRTGEVWQADREGRLR
ncbi:MAG: metallophosphoesterase family protein [Planctomycetota bacterium]